MSEIYLNGGFVPAHQASISPLDRGFLFGDGVYEVIPAYGGVLFRLQQHLERLARSLRAIRLSNPYPDARWHALLQELVARHGGGDQSIYLQVTRGAAERNHAFPQGVAATVMAMSHPLESSITEAWSRGVSAVTLPDIRWQHCDIKAIALLPNVLLRQQAVDAGAVEAILLRDGSAMEGAASNLFIVRDGVLMTPPNGPLLLPGVTRAVVLELARANGLSSAEAPIPEADLRAAQEIWLTSSTREVVPVTRLDGRAVSDGQPGPVWARMHAWFQDYKREYRSLHARPEAASDAH